MPRTIVDSETPLRPASACEFRASQVVSALGLAQHGVRLCPLHKRLDDAIAVMESAFRNTTLAEILAEPTTSKPLCEPPQRIRLK